MSWKDSSTCIHGYLTGDVVFGNDGHYARDGRGSAPFRYVPPKRVGFLYRFSLKTGVDFGLESRVWFSRELRKCMNVLSFRSQMGKKEKETCEFVEDLKKFFSSLF